MALTSLEGISRSYNWVIVAMMPGYVFRPILVTAFMVLTYLADYPMNAVTAVIVGALALWVPTLAQTFILNSRLPAKIEQGLRRYEFKTWLSTSLPILLVALFCEAIMLFFVTRRRLGLHVFICGGMRR